MKKKYRKPVIIIFASCLIAMALFVWIYSTIPSPDTFDKLIKTDLINSGCKNVVPHSITCYKSTFQLEYRVNFELDTTEPDLFSMIIIKVRPGWFFSPIGGMVISPFGGGDMTSITTSDGKFDIIVEQHNKGMKGVISPEVSTEKLSKELYRCYSKMEKSNK